MVEKKKDETNQESTETEAKAPEQATEEAAPKEAAPKEVAPKEAAPKEAAPKEATPKEAAPASFDEIEQGGEPTHVNDNIERILDIPITVAVEVGRVKMLINDLLQLGHGSVIELEKTAGEPMEILVNDRLVAKGEVVAVNEKFGIRLTDIISPTERIKQLRK